MIHPYPQLKQWAEKKTKSRNTPDFLLHIKGGEPPVEANSAIINCLFTGLNRSEFATFEMVEVANGLFKVNMRGVAIIPLTEYNTLKAARGGR